MPKPDLSTGIAERVRTEILSGAYSLGERLPSETVLAQTFGVSRPTLREALHRLAAQGYIETRRGAHGGAFVTKDRAESLAGPMAELLELAALRDGFGAGTMLEGYATLLAVALDGPLSGKMNGAAGAAAAALDPALAALRAATPETLAEVHRDFHLALCEAAPNPPARLVARALAEAAGAALTPEAPTAADCGRLAALCTRLAGALGAGDAPQLRRNLADWCAFLALRHGDEAEVA